MRLARMTVVGELSKLRRRGTSVDPYESQTMEHEKRLQSFFAERSQDHSHPELLLRRAATVTMDECPQAIAIMSGAGQPPSEDEWRSARAQLVESIKSVIPSVSIMEAADIMIFIGMVLHPKSDIEWEEIDRDRARSRQNATTINTRNAKR